MCPLTATHSEAEHIDERHRTRTWRLRMNEPQPNSQVDLEEGMAALREARNELTHLLDDLQSELGPSLDQWENDAHIAFVEAQRCWNVSTAKQESIVQHLPDLLEGT